MDQLVLRWSTLMNSLFQSIQNKAGIGCAACAPTNDPPREHIDDEGDVDKPLPCGDICEVADPKDVRRGSMELPVHTIQRTG